jgi:tetraacyldisaccharide 4'-kinase
MKLLIPFSFIYYLIISLRDFFYRSRIFKGHALDARVISVGNLTWGGTGKTPATLFILDVLLQRGKKAAILIRGYGKDEPRLLLSLATGVPVFVGSDRVRNGREAIIQHSVDTLLLDDGFQYRRLKRDLDIVCIDATNPFGNGWMIPAGIMREGLNSLKKADIFLITKVDLISDQHSLQDLETRLRTINPMALIVKSIHKVGHIYKLSDGQLVDIEYLKDKNLGLISAIGNPRSFEKTVSMLGLRFGKHFMFRDHYWYTEKDLKRIKDYCTTHEIDAILTTEKDAVRLQGIKDKEWKIGIFVVAIKLQAIENEQLFHDRLFRIYNT